MNCNVEVHVWFYLRTFWWDKCKGNICSIMWQSFKIRTNRVKLNCEKQTFTSRIWKWFSPTIFSLGQWTRPLNKHRRRPDRALGNVSIDALACKSTRVLETLPRVLSDPHFRGRPNHSEHLYILYIDGFEKRIFSASVNEAIE